MNIRCFLPTKFSEILFNKTIDWLSICFKTRSQAFETPSGTFQTLDRAFEALREKQKLNRVFEKLCRASVEKAPRVSVITFPIQSQSGTVVTKD